MKLTLIRSDGEKLEFSTLNGYSTEASDDWFDSKPITNSTIEYAGADGGALIKQTYGMWPITVSGSIHGKTIADVRNKAKKLHSFLAKNYYFTAVFTECDGTQMASHQVFISTAPAVVMRSKLEFSRTYSFQMTLTDPYLYEYSTDEEGNETYANSISVPLFVETEGGYYSVADGYIYYNGGYTYARAGGDYFRAIVDTSDNVAPVWVIHGPATNPSIANLTTDTAVTVDTTIAKGQTLTVDMASQTAYIGTADFTDLVTGEWLTLTNGQNVLKFSTDNTTDAEYSELEWNGVVF